MKWKDSILWKNKKRIRQGKDILVPMYTAQEAIDSLEVFRPVNYDEIVDIDENIKIILLGDGKGIW